MTVKPTTLNSSQRSPINALLMLLTYCATLLIGIYLFQPDVESAAWLATNKQTEFALAERLSSLGFGFWMSQSLIGLLALTLPFHRPIRASLITLLITCMVIAINYQLSQPEEWGSLEYLLLVVLILFSQYIILSFIGEVRDREKLSAIFGQYVPPELAEKYSRDPESINLEGQAREVTVLFCDVRGFTSISETLDPKVLATWLNRYFSEISQVVVKYDGTLDKYIGDSVMAFWGAPEKSATHARDALRAANEMQKRMHVLSREFQKEGLPAISVGIGMSTGIGNVGNLGSEYRMAYTVVGDVVNMAQRLERQTRNYDVPIIVSGTTASQVKDVLFRELDEVRVKGRQGRAHMFQPLCKKDMATPEMLTNLEAHKKARLMLEANDKDNAKKMFEALKGSWPSNRCYDIYINRLNATTQSGHK